MRARCSGVIWVGLIAALCWAWPALADISVKAVRLWPSPDYSRITLELSAQPEYKVFTLDKPDRLVIDLTGVDGGPVLQGAASEVSAQDPLIATIRSGINRPDVTRVVVELKGAVSPKVFTLPPMGPYGERLVVDLYPSADKQVADTENQVEQAIAQAAAGGADAGQQPAASAAASSDKPASDKSAGQGSVADQPKKPGYVRLITVAVDAGHGGEDPGATGPDGVHEKDITLAVARRLKADIDKMPNMRAVLIRDGDYFIPLHERVVKARKARADLFVSIHADSFPDSSARGSSVFALSEKGATSAAARWLAKRENDADLIGGVNIDVKDRYLKKTLIDLSQTATISDSLRLGNDVLDQLSDINDLHRGHVEQAGFAVLKAPDIPSILVETAFISNPTEEKRLLTDAYQDKLAAAIATGIKQYFDKNPPLAGGRMARNM